MKSSILFLLAAAVFLNAENTKTEEAFPDVSIITVDGISFSAFDSTENISGALGDKITFNITESGDWLCGCLDINTAVFFVPNYETDPAAFEMYNGLNGASDKEEIEQVLGSGCLKAVDDKGTHFLEAFINDKEIDYSQIAVADNWEETSVAVYDYCCEASEENDRILLFYYNCNPDGSNGHIVDVYLNTGE